MHHLITQRFDVNIDSEYLQEILTNLLEHQRKVFVNVFRDFEVEKDIHTTQSKIVEKTEEVNADRHRNRKGSNKMSCI